MRFLILLLAFGAVGCASATKQTDAFLSHEKAFGAVPAMTVIDDVPFIDQAVGQCGPATLAMAMNWAGRSVPVEELASQVMTPGMNGSLQSDMLTAARRQGFVAVPIHGLRALVREVDQGQPVIVFENLALSWYPQWHYAIVFGYDLQTEEVVMHSGPEAHKRWDMRKFERSWQLADYWGMVVLPPGSLSASAGEVENAAAASALEQFGFAKEAELTYQAILQRWPQSLVARVGLANLAFVQGDYSAARVQLESAAKDHPESAVVWHNLAIAQASLKNARQAKESAQQAMKFVSSEDRASYQQRLGNWL